MTVVALSGGVGGAKLALGLASHLGRNLHVACNAGDDFDYLGFAIWPDFDTVLYTLAGVADAERGWGRADESWAFMEAFAAIGGEDWFRLGDRDLAVHVVRTRMLAEGQRPSAVAAHLGAAFGVASSIEPACEDQVRTMVATDIGELSFQEYFVRHQCRPRIEGLRFVGGDEAVPAPRLAEAISAGCDGFVICPSNPYLSLAPMFAVPGITEALRARRVPSIAVSPIIGGAAVKGPTAKIMAELGIAPTAAAIAKMLSPYIDVFVLDRADAELADEVARLGIRPVIAKTLMTTLADKEALAVTVLSELERGA